MVRSVAGAMALAMLLNASFVQADEPAKGTIRFEPAENEKTAVPERYRLEGQTLDYTLALRYELRHSGVNVYNLTFPSPVKSAIPENDTVYAEYFVPSSASAGDKVPAAIVLDILDGAAVVARGEAVWLAQHGIASLFVQIGRAHV